VKKKLPPPSTPEIKQKLKKVKNPELKKALKAQLAVGKKI
jgi:hypothetical protein